MLLSVVDHLFVADGLQVIQRVFQHARCLCAQIVRKIPFGYNTDAVTTPAEKGNALEIAVAAIERQILQTSPGLRENTFRIESKKIIDIGGVHHEIDIFVTIDLGQGYKSVFIFECKNWTDAVGKNEVVVFSEKIDASQAQHGYLIARSFTKDAEAQAKKDPRMTLLLATEHDPTGMPVPFDFHYVNPELERVDVDFRKQNSTGLESSPIEVTTAQAKLQGSSINLHQYLMKWADETCNENMRTFPSGRLSEGVYDRIADSTREFAQGELLLNGESIKTVVLSITFKVRVLRPAVVSHFEVESRGRVLFFAPVAFVGSTLRTSLILGAPK